MRTKKKKAAKTAENLPFIIIIVEEKRSKINSIEIPEKHCCAPGNFLYTQKKGHILKTPFPARVPSPGKPKAVKNQHS